MKEPWKKACNGKVIITLNDEKTEPTEVEVPVDLNWTHPTDKKCSTPKVFVLVGITLLVALSLANLFKVQDLLYSTSFINWRVTELESSVGDSIDDIKLIKYKLSLDDRDEDVASIRAIRAEPLVGSSRGRNQLDSHDLKLSESQNQKLTSNSLTENDESKAKEISQGKSVQSKENKDADDINDGRNQVNPSDSDEWIKPLVETFDVIGNQPIEDDFIHNVLMKLLMPQKDFEVLELNKMQDSGNSAQEPEGPKINMIPLMRNMREKQQVKPFPFENMLMKNLLPPIGNFKIFHFNEKPEAQPQQLQEEEQMMPKVVKFKQMLPPPIESIMKALLPPSNMKIFPINEKPEQGSSEEDVPKITIQSIKLKLLPLPSQEDFQPRREMMRDPLRGPINMNNFEILRLNESPEGSQDIEAQRAPMPMPMGFNAIPIPIHEIMRSILPSSKNIEIVPLNERPEDHQPMLQQQHQQQPRDEVGMAPEHKFNPFQIPIQEIIMKTLMPPSQNAEAPFNSESQDQTNADLEVQKIPIRTMKLNPFPIPEALMKSMLPIDHFSEAIDSISESREEDPEPQPQAPAQQPQQQVPTETQQSSESQPQADQPEQPKLKAESTPAPQEPAKIQPRSTKLNPVDPTWDVPQQYASQPN